MKNSTNFPRIVFLGVFFMLFSSSIFAQKDEESSRNQIPTMDQVLKDMQKGQKYNLKKVLNHNLKETIPNTGRKDNPQLRQAFDLMRLRDPKTGKIPAGIREKELDYVLSPEAHMRDAKLQLKSKRSNGLRAPGDILTPWINRGPFNVGGRTRALALDINDENRILAGGASGGLWESTDLGATWSRITPPQDHPTITDIVQDPRDGFQNIWYYGTGEDAGNAGARNFSARFVGNGIYKSTDNGQTFSPLAVTVSNTPQGLSTAEPFEVIYNIDINPVNGDLYAATLFGIYRSTNGGTSFEPVLLNGGGTTVAGVITESDIHITSTGVLYAALESNATESGIFRSTTGNAGEWTNITDAGFPTAFGRTVISTAPSNENVLYVYATNTDAAPVNVDFWKYTYVSGNGTGVGGTWEDRSANLPGFGAPVGDVDTQGGYNMFVVVHPSDENIVFLGATDVFRSTDGFATPITLAGWVAGYSPNNNISLYTNHHPDNHALIFVPSNPNMAISGHDGGLSITDDILATNPGIEPVAWNSLNNGYLTTQAYAVSFGPGDQIMVGFQDNSTWLTTSAASDAVWSDQFSGDGSYNAFNDDGTVRYLSSQNGRVFRITYDNADSEVATSFQEIRPAATVNPATGAFDGIFVNPFELDPNNDEIMYFPAGNVVWRNNDLLNANTSAGWTEITNGVVASGNISTISVSTIPANVVYYGTTTGGIYRLDNANVGNPTAVDIFTGKGLPTGNVSSIAVDETNANNIYATFSNYSIPSIFFSDDAGDTWTDISGNLEENADGSGSGPSVRWFNIVGRNNIYLTATSTGLYSTTTIDGASTVWTQVDPNGIGNAVAEQVRSREDGLVVLGTYGNGIYSATFEVDSNPVIVANEITNIVVDANDPDTEIDVSAVFSSTLAVPLDITVTIENNSNSSLITTDVDGDLLTLSYTPDTFGSATISLRGDDGNGGAVITSFEVLVNPFPVNSFPYLESFDNDGGALPGGWGIVSLSPFNWAINSGGTPSAGTGPLNDNTTGTTGFYLYTEASGPNLGDEASILSREIDLTGTTSPQLDFNYHMFGPTIGTLNVNVITTTDTTNVFTLTGQQQAAQADPYIETRVDLTAFQGEVIRIEFEGLRGDGFTGDIAIDDLSVVDLSFNDLQVVSIDSHVEGESVLANQVIIATFSNSGINAQSNFDVVYSVGGLEIGRETITTVLNREDELQHTFAMPFNFTTPGPVNLEVTVELATDEIPANNSLAIELIVANPITAYPYVETFDNDGGNLPAQWAIEDLSLFDWIVDSDGTPSGGTGPLGDNTTGTGFYVYTEATGANLDDQASLLTPYFDLDGLTAPELSFAYHMFGDSIGTLNVNVISISGGTTNIFTLSEEQQANQDDDYITAIVDLSAFINDTIRIQFEGIRGNDFTSDIAIDDVEVSDLSNNDLEVVSIDSPESLVFGDETVSATFRNAGLVAQSDFDVTYSVNGNEIDRQTITSTLDPGQELEVTFATTFDFSAVAAYQLEVEVILTGDEVIENDAILTEVRRALFTGDYVMIQLVNGSALSAQGNPNVFAANGINTPVFVDFISETEREISIEYGSGIGIGQGAFPFTFTLNAMTGDVVFGNDQFSGLQFGPTRPILFSAGATPGVYDPMDESAFTMTLVEDASNEGGAGPFQASFQLFMNEAPTLIDLSNAEVMDNLLLGETIGILTTTDANPNDRFSYSVGGTDGASFAIGPNNTLVSAVEFDAAVQSSFDITVIATDAGGQSIDEDFTITVGDGTGTWTGTVDNDWNNPNNWDDGVVPTDLQDAVIPGGVTNIPVIISGDFIFINSLFVEATGSISIEAGGFLALINNLSNEGSVSIASGGSLAIIGTRSGGGTSTFNRNLTGNSALSIVGSPITGLTVADLNADLIFGYDNTNQEFTNVPVVEDLNPGSGYFVSSFENTYSLSFEGSLNAGTVNVPVTDGTTGDAFNLVANPYAASIIASTFFLNDNNTANTTGSLYLWDDGGSNTAGNEGRGGDYVTVNSMGAVSGVVDLGNGIDGTNGSSAFIGSINSGQGFFIEATNSGSVTFTPNMQGINNLDANFFRTANQQNNRNILKLSLAGVDSENSNLYNETMIGFDANATIGVDYSLDARKFSGNENISFYSLLGDESYAIQALPKVLEETFELQLAFNVDVAGTYKLSVQDFINVDGEEFKLYLNDNLAGQSYDLSNLNDVLFQTSATDLDKRFTITLTPNTVSEIDDSEFNATSLKLIRGNSESLIIGYPAASEHVVIHDLAGKTIFDSEMNFENAQTVVKTNFSSNTVYILRINEEAIKFILK